MTEADTSAFTKTDDVVTLNYKAYAGKTGYNTVQEAVDAATNGQTVVLLSDVIGNVEIPAGKDIAIDFGGHTITSEIMSGTAGFHNLGTVTLKNGTFTHSKDDKNFYLIQNHGTMVMENMSIIGHANSASMVINGKDGSNDNGIVVNEQINGNLTINNCSLIQKGAFIALKNEFGTCVVNDSVLSRENTHNVINAWDTTTLNNCIVTGGVMFGNYIGNSTTLRINGGTYDCIWFHEYLNKDNQPNGKAKLIIANANFTNPSMTAKFSSCPTNILDIEMTNTKMAADLSQWLAK